MSFSIVAGTPDKLDAVEACTVVVANGDQAFFQVVSHESHMPQGNVAYNQSTNELEISFGCRWPDSGDVLKNGCCSRDAKGEITDSITFPSDAVESASAFLKIPLEVDAFPNPGNSEMVSKKLEKFVNQGFTISLDFEQLHKEEDKSTGFAFPRLNAGEIKPKSTKKYYNYFYRSILRDNDVFARNEVIHSSSGVYFLVGNGQVAGIPKSRNVFCNGGQSVLSGEIKVLPGSAQVLKNPTPLTHNDMQKDSKVKIGTWRIEGTISRKPCG